MSSLLNVFGLDAVDAVVRPLVIALPVLVLATLIALLARVRRNAKRRAAVRAADAKAQSSIRATADPVAPLPPPPARPSTDDQKATTAPAQPEPRELTFYATAPTTPAANLPPADPRQISIEALQFKLNEAMKVQSKATLAPMFLDMAKHHKAAGDEQSYLAALRSAAGLAAQHGPSSAHAEARLALAEAAFQNGDPIGACEQWQMARNALLEDGQKEAHARVEQRMRDNGCPTDWVLTDF